jgi:hypothetical protein
MRYLWAVFLLITTPALAAKIQGVKNNKVLINLEGQKVEPGQSFFVVDSGGKKRAIVRIRQIKEDRAVAEITKGNAEVGYSLSGEAASAPKVSNSNSTTTHAAKRPQKRITEITTEESGARVGILGSILQNTMAASFTAASTGSKTTSNMTGMTFGIIGFYDYAFSPALQIRGAAGIENYAATGSTPNSDCDNSTSCDVKIMYLSLYGAGKFNFYLDSKMRIWAGGFFAYLYALSKSSSILRTDDISYTPAYGPSIGLDYALDKRTFIPIQLDYGFISDTSTVKATTIFVRAGWGTNF